MRYKQKKRRSSLVVNNSISEEKINGNKVNDIVVNGKLQSNEDSMDDKNMITIDDSNEDSNDIQVVDQNGAKNKADIDDKVSVRSDPNPKQLNELTAELTENDKYFSSLIDLIPAKIYFEGNEEILESMEKQKRDLFGDDLDLSKKSKQKRFKLDTNSGKKISEIANNFYNKSNKNSKQNQSVDNKMDELKKKLNEKITRLKSGRNNKSKNQRDSKKERKRQNQIRAHKQKGFSKRQHLEAGEVDTNGSEPKPKKMKSEDMTDGTNHQKGPKNLPKIYNKDGAIVYSKFDLVSTSVDSLAEKKKHLKKHKLQRLLTKTEKEEQKMAELVANNAPKAQEVKEKKLWRKAIDLSEGIKVKDNSKLIKKSIMKKRNDKKKSQDKWSERKESLQKSMDKKQDKRNKNIKERKQSRRDKKLKIMKKKGHIVDTN